MHRSSLFISTIALVGALGCGGRESGILGAPSGSSSGAHGGTGTDANGGASGGANGNVSADTTGGGSAGTGTGGSMSATAGSVAVTGGGPCLIVQPSSYDQSCFADTDCVLVGPGATSCDPGCRCGNATVNAKAEAQYNKDLARALALAGPGITCHCPSIVPTIPYCHARTCQFEVWIPDAAPMPADAASFDSTGANMVDAQADTGPGANCPSALPQAGGACEGPIDCRYPDTCGPVTLRCAASKSYWAVAQRTQCGGGCPLAEPKQGDACMASGKCSYTSACGSQDTVYCDGTGTAMRIDYGTCPKCPDQEPAPLAACFGSLSCMYTNSCGGADMASCSGSSWTVLRGDCEK
ncbi:MAG TPA: hypothetical protein VGY54_15930 [Polyangiaceae bacterium]|jgi:hypothetical protein|nr:hypothetical protein [Polyangiaceae bacterium]